MADRLTDRPLTNTAYGFPRRGARRRIKPVILAVAHITGNSRTAAYEDPLEGARAELRYADRKGSKGPSAHLYIGRDGRGFRALDWRRFAAWSNGDVMQPNRDNAGIRRALALRARGYNLNEACGIEAECVGYGASMPVTAAQRDTLAEEIARAARHWRAHFEELLGVSGAAIIRPSTVVGHFEINGVNRRNCPARPADHDAFLADLIARSRAWYRKLYEPAPEPDPEEYPDVIVTSTEAADVIVRQGATLRDLNGEPAVKVSNTKARRSPGATSAGRLVYARWAGATHLTVAAEADVVSSEPVLPPDQAGRIRELEERVRDCGAAAGPLRAAAAAINTTAAALESAADI